MRYGTELDRAIRQALATGVRPSVLLRSLRAGTFEGHPAFPELAERTFWQRWTTVKHEHHRRGGRPVGPTPLNLIDYIAISERAEELHSADPKTIAADTEYSQAQVRAALEFRAKWRNQTYEEYARSLEGVAA